jgi:hypothetical protein
VLEGKSNAFVYIGHHNARLDSEAGCLHSRIVIADGKKLGPTLIPETDPPDAKKPRECGAF